MSDPFCVEPFRATTNITFGSKDAVAACKKVWREFFKRLKRYDNPDEPFDIAIWEIKAVSCSVRCRPGSSRRDENDPAREPPGMIHFAVEGMGDEQRAIYALMDSQTVTEKEGYRRIRELNTKFYDWIFQAVLEAFLTDTIQKMLHECVANKQFSVFATPNDEGLDSSKLTLIWKNKLGLTAEQVREQAILLSRGSANKRAVKKLPAKLRAEGRMAKSVKKSTAKKLPVKKRPTSKKTGAAKLAKKTATAKSVKKVKKAKSAKKKRD